MQRYFANKINENIVLNNDDQHHILNVLRAKNGERIEVVVDNELFLCEINSIKPFEIKIVTKLESKSEIDNDITLLFALSKGDKIDFVITKATELGAKRIVLFNSSRCVCKISNDDFNKKVVRYNKIAKEAAEQCHRFTIPVVQGVENIKYLSNTLISDINLVAYEKESGNTLKTYDLLSNIQNKQSVSIMVGPEGGFSEEEIDGLNRLGFENISLGKRILRCETAAVYALSILGFMLER